MPPDIIQTQKEVARSMLYGINTPTPNLDEVVTTIIANIGRELEARCEDGKIGFTDERFRAGYNAAIDRTLTLIRDVTGISPTK